MHSVPALVAYLSKLMTLSRATWCPPARPRVSASLRDPRVWLKAGDEVLISSPQLGELHTRLA